MSRSRKAKKEKPNPHWLRIVVYKLTKDTWYPSHMINGHVIAKGAMAVELSLLSLSSGKFRICAWGTDDYGLERDFEDEAEARTLFWELLGMEYINQNDLHIRKFRGA